MLRPEIRAPELDLTTLIFYARRSVHIHAICSEKFLGDFFKFKTLNAQKLDDLMLLQIHRIGAFRLFTICISDMPASFSQGNPKLSQHA
jgi:hypothetical protein